MDKAPKFPGTEREKLVVGAYQWLADNLPEVVEQLEKRPGKDELLTPEQSEAVKNLYDTVFSLCAAIRERFPDEKGERMAMEVLGAVWAGLLVNDPAELEAELKKKLESLGYSLEDFPRSVSTIPTKILYVKDVVEIVENAAKVVKQVERQHVHPKQAKEYVKPLDKCTEKVFDVELSRTFQDSQDGEEYIKIRTSPNGQAHKAHVYLSLNFDELKETATISKELTAYDRRIYEVLGSLICAGNRIVTLQMIHEAATGAKRPNAAQRDKIRESVEKMQRTWLKMDNRPELKAKYNYPKFVFNGHLIPFSRIDVVNRGQVTDFALEIPKEEQLPLFRFADQRGQIAKLPINVLWTKASKTEKQIKREDYLLQRIKRNDKYQKILWNTYCKNVGLEVDAPYYAKQRELTAIKDVLSYWKTLGVITSFTVTDEFISWQKGDEK